jgi:hypothetical protein
MQTEITTHWPQAGDIYERRTEHWTIRRYVTGMNGIGCPWLNEHWLWPSGGLCRRDVLTLSLEQTEQMIKDFVLTNPPNADLSHTPPKAQ